MKIDRKDFLKSHHITEGNGPLRHKVEILLGDVVTRLRGLRPESIHCVVTSPPYWNLREYGVKGQLGQEPTYQEYIANMVRVFREVRRVLRKDGIVWLNLGDTYGSGNGNATPGAIKPKDLGMMPARVAIALQEDGWWLRSDIIWHKPNPMPSSVTDRPTSSHEYIFLLAKSGLYYFDQYAVREKARVGYLDTDFIPTSDKDKAYSKSKIQTAATGASTKGRVGKFVDTRNLRDVWTIPVYAFRELHFATFPPKLVEPCIKAGTSAHGVCSKCGAPWQRIEELKWEQTCKCRGAEIMPATVLDPFGGSGTVGIVANELGRNAVLIELNGDYVAIAENRIVNARGPWVEVEVKGKDVA